MDNIRDKVFSGVIWKGLERICAQLVSTVVGIVLARILGPKDYSVVSIVAIFFAFCNIFHILILLHYYFLINYFI